MAILAHDPRPSYKGECDREYGMIYGEHEIFFIADECKLKVTKIKKRNKK